jgi:hypothetical protein
VAPPSGAGREYDIFHKRSMVPLSCIADTGAPEARCESFSRRDESLHPGAERGASCAGTVHHPIVVTRSMGPTMGSAAPVAVAITFSR